MKQLSFGYIFRDEPLLPDASGRRVPGVLPVSGSERLYAKNLQRLNFLLEEPLGQHAAYTVVIKDENGERAGSLDFAARFR